MEERAESIQISKNRKPYSINIKLLPLKLHYFFSYGGFAAVIPFLPIIAKRIGINATAYGIGFSTKPIFIFLSNPIIGILVDYFRNIKKFLIVLLISSSVSYASILWLPPISYENTDVVYISISSFNESKAFFNISKPFERSCLEKILQNHTDCKLAVGNEKERSTNESSDSDSMISLTYDANQMENNNQAKENKHRIAFCIKNTTLLERQDASTSYNILCSPSVHHCSIEDKPHDILKAYQLWLFFILVVFSSITSLSANSLSTVACFEILGNNPEAYGRQRLFGTLGWGIICPLSGLLSDVYADGHFLSIIFLMTLFRTIDIIILCVISLPKAHSSSNMSRDLRIIITSREILVFSFGITVIGFLAAIISVFEFWFLEDMGASRTLLGLSVLMQCLVGEVPFLFFSGWFVKKLGHFLCFTCVFLGFLVRLVCYFFIKNPWLVLPVDTLHGLTFGLFHGTMASYAKENAPKGMEATVLGLFCGLYEGLGYGTGSFMGGFGLDKLGPRQTFLSASMLSLGCFLIFLLASYLFRRSQKTQRSEFSSLATEEMPTIS